MYVELCRPIVPVYSSVSVQDSRERLTVCSTYAEIPRTTAAQMARSVLLVVTIAKGDLNILKLYTESVSGGKEPQHPQE
jgi:hypothetical protein